MRLLTYNIHKGIGGTDGRYDLRRVIDLLESQNPDVICLQEVDRNVRRSGHDNQPRLLAEHFRAHSLFQLNVHVEQGGYGNLILSRWNFVQSHQISLQWGPRKMRGAQISVVDTPEGAVHIVNVHLGLGAGERNWQWNHLLVHRLFRESADYPTLIAGDFNDWRNLLERRAEAEGFTQLTRPLSRFRSFPAALPVGSLDKVYARGAFVKTVARVVHGRLARVASDHLPLVVDFHLIQPGNELSPDGPRRVSVDV